MHLRIFSFWARAYLFVAAIAVSCNAQHILQAEHYEEQEVLQYASNGRAVDQGDDLFKRPKNIYHDSHTASKVARRLVSNNTVAMINTNFHDGNETVAMSFPEYAIDCLDSGDPVLLLITMSHNWRNIAANEGYDSSITYTVDSSDIEADWPGAVTGSMYGMPRVNLRGHFRLLQVEGNGDKTADIGQPLDVRYISKEESERIKGCFLSKHKESEVWFPDNKNRAHNSLWTEFVVESGYFVGGFGGYAYIGGLNGDEYHDIDDSKSSFHTGKL